MPLGRMYGGRKEGMVAQLSCAHHRGVRGLRHAFDLEGRRFFHAGGAVAALMKRNLFWYIGMGGGELRFAFFLQRIFPVHAIGLLQGAIPWPHD